MTGRLAAGVIARRIQANWSCRSIDCLGRRFQAGSSHVPVRRACSRACSLLQPFLQAPQADMSAGSTTSTSSALPASTMAGTLPSGPLPAGMGPLPPPLPTREQAAAGGGSWWAKFKAAVKRVKREVLALHYANQDPRTGLLPRLFILLALAYALSPIDLIPDFIPVLGLVDDLLILPGLILLARWLIPAEVMAAARQRADHEPLRLHRAWGTAALVFVLWDALLLWAAWWVCGHFGSQVVQQYKVWAVASLGVLLVAAEAGWVVAAHRKEAGYASALSAAGAQPDLQRVLLSGHSDRVHEYLEP